jgi:hypothetical protein
MTDSVYCACTSETQANTILTHLRNDGFGTEISVFLQDRSDTKDMSLKENAIRGAEFGGLVGAFVSLMVPGLGSVLAIGPLLGVLNGVVAGGVVGGLLGGSGGLKPLNLPEAVEKRIHQHIGQGQILISIHSSDPLKLSKAMEVFRSEGASNIFDSRNQPV